MDLHRLRRGTSIVRLRAATLGIAPGLQWALQNHAALIGSAKRILASTSPTYTRSCGFRPIASIACEHMFPSTRTSTIAQRALGAVGVARSFLLLEDDYDVDWEVDQDELLHAPHPHRAPLRRGSAPRRPGQLRHAPQHCISPVAGAGWVSAQPLWQEPDGCSGQESRGSRTLQR